MAEYFLSTAKKLEDKNQEEGGLEAAVGSVEIQEDDGKAEGKKDETL